MVYSVHITNIQHSKKEVKSIRGHKKFSICGFLPLEISSKHFIHFFCMTHRCLYPHKNQLNLFKFKIKNKLTI